MRVTPAVVEREREWTLDRAPIVVEIANDVRARLGTLFDTAVDDVTVSQYRTLIEETYADGDQAVNLAAMTALLRDLDVVDDYPGFVVDELLGREIAGLIAGEQPSRLLAEATFHFADVHTHGEGPAGADDLDAALAAGVQTRLPGWDWQEAEPFDR